MNSKQFIFLIIFSLMFFSVNVFAEYFFQMENVSIITVPNPNGPPDGPNAIGENAYYNQGPPVVALEEVPDPDWIEVRFTLRNLSTNTSGEPTSVPNFEITFYLTNIADRYADEFDFRLESPNSGVYVTMELDNLVMYYPDSEPAFAYNTTKEFAIQFPVNDIVLNTNYDTRNLTMRITYAETNNGYLVDVDTGARLNLYLHDLDPVTDPVFHDLAVFLDPITCLDPATGEPAPFGSIPGTGSHFPYDPIRCDSIDSNTIYYEIRMVDINSEHINEYLKVNYFDFYCNNSTYPVPTSRILHDHDGFPGSVYPSDIGQYEGFPATCEFLHYSDDDPMHTDCLINAGTGFPEYASVPELLAIADCPAGTSCFEQDKNIYYNTSAFEFRKYLDPDEFTFHLGDEKIFSGTITNAKTGGNFYCRFSNFSYTLFDSSDNEIETRDRGHVTQHFIYDGSNQRLYDGTGDYIVRLLKLAGQDAFILKNGSFMPSSIYVRPLVPWTVEIPILNTGYPLDGTKGDLFLDVNVINQSWVVMSKTLALDGSDAEHTLLTDEDKMFIMSFPINEGAYHQFLTAGAMNAKLYDINGWIYDLTPDTPIENVRLITILHPVMYEIWGDLCFDPDFLLYDYCWWNELPYYFLPQDYLRIDLNANADIEFVLRLRSPFDFNEFFDLTYETNNPGNARLEFVPERNFVPPFSSGEFGYKYSKMILINPRILRGDANYHVIDTSVNYPYVWDDLKVEFKNFSHNLKIESFDVNEIKEEYSLGEVLDFSLVITNTGNIVERDINFLVVSSMDPNVRFYAPDDTNIDAGQTLTFTGTLPAIPFKDVFVVEATVEPVEFEFTVNDNTKQIFLRTEYSGNVSALPETNYFYVILVSLIVLFVVIKK